MDDSSLQGVVIVPRIPPGWKGVEAQNWPIRTSGGIVRAHIVYEKKAVGYELALTLAKGEVIDDLKVRMPSAKGYVWREQKHVSTARFETWETAFDSQNDCNQLRMIDKTFWQI